MINFAYRPLLGALLLGFAMSGLAAAAQSLSPDAVVAGASTYDGQSISITGVVKNLHSHTGRYGTIESYDVCATQCVHVFDRSGTAVTEGAAVTTAAGVFHAQMQPHGGNSTSSTHHFPTTNVLFIAAPGSSH